MRCAAALAALQLLSACAAPTPPSPFTVRVAATDLTAPLLSDLIAAYADANPEVTLSPTVVPLSTLRKTPGLKNMLLLRHGRLSVQPVTPKQWEIILRIEARI